MLLIAASCGGAVTSNDSTTSNDDAKDSGAPTPIASDGGFAKVPSPIADAGIFTPIDTSQWKTDGTCSFTDAFIDTDTPFDVTGTRVVAFLAGTEIPYLVFGCSDGTTTFLGATISDADSGVNDPQWALFDQDNESYWVDDAHISRCNLVETSSSFGTIGTPVSGSFSCNAMPGPNGLYMNVSGTFSTVLSERAPFDLP